MDASCSALARRSPMGPGALDSPMMLCPGRLEAQSDHWSEVGRPQCGTSTERYYKRQAATTLGGQDGGLWEKHARSALGPCEWAATESARQTQHSRGLT